MNTEPKVSPPDAVCERLGDDLKAYLDGELSLGRHAVVLFHLGRCPACRQELSWMQTLTEELKTEQQQDTAPMSEDLRAKILQSAPASPVTNGQKDAPTPTKVRRPLVPRGLMQGVAFASLACMLCFVWLTMTTVKLKNSFNTAAASIDNSTDGEPYYSPQAGSAPAASEASKTSEDYGANGSDVSGAIPVAPSPNSNLLTRKVHKEGRLTVAVLDVDTKSLAVESLIKGVGGYVASNALSTGANNLKTASLDVRVPVGQFESVVNQISRLGDVRDKSISGQDITEEYVTSNARRQTLAQELAIREAQLRQKEKSAKKSDFATLWQLRGEVRSLRLQASEARARLQMTQKLADLATLSVTLQQKPQPVKTAGFTQSLGSTGQDALASFVMAARLPLQLLIWIMAYSPFWVPALLVWRKYGRKWMEVR